METITINAKASDLLRTHDDEGWPMTLPVLQVSRATAEAAGIGPLIHVLDTRVYRVEYDEDGNEFQITDTAPGRGTWWCGMRNRYG